MHPEFDTTDFVTNLEAAAQAVAAARFVAVLSGAGVSAESGIRTFRAADGLWEEHRIEDVASPGGFRRDPALVWRFYNARRLNAAAAEPNAGHLALAQMQAEWTGGPFTVITQNVDGLHQRAGTAGVLELHGSLWRTRCLGCERVDDAPAGDTCDLGEKPLCPHCGSRLRPDIVWFGETLDPAVWTAAETAAAACDVMLVVGTNASVYPAAGLAQVAQASGDAKVIEINIARTELRARADIGLYRPSGETLPLLRERVNALRGSA